jgi:hypothetical protein
MEKKITQNFGWEKRGLGKRACSWENDIKVDLTETRHVDVNLIQLVYIRVQWRANVSRFMFRKSKKF